MILAVIEGFFNILKQVQISYTKMLQIFQSPVFRQYAVVIIGKWEHLKKKLVIEDIFQLQFKINIFCC